MKFYSFSGQFIQLDDGVLKTSFYGLALPQKAVRVTTLMKRLRAPEQRDSGTSSPVPGGSTCPVTSSNTPVPSADAPEGTPVSTEASVTLQVPDSQNPPAIITPDEPEADPLQRCNGDAAVSLQTPPQTQDDQNG